MKARSQVEKDEFRMQVRRELEEMDVGREREGEMFERAVNVLEAVMVAVGGDGGGERKRVREGVCGIWVEEVEVKGVRN